MKKYFSNILLGWVESLQVLQPKNLIQLAQVTLKTWLDLCWALGRHFWWLIAAGMAMFAMRPHWITLIILLIVWLLLLILMVRPSLQQKNLDYLREYALYGFPLFLLLLVPCCVPWIGIAIVAPYLFLTMFFLCDAQLKLSCMLIAPVHAAHMALAKLPIYLLFSLAFHFASWLDPFLNVLFALPLILSALSRCYVLWLHKNYQGYYDGAC